MTPITRYCRTPAIYWEPIGSDGRGRFLLKEPVEILVRWEDAAGIIVSRTQGEWRPAVKLITPLLLKEYGKIMLGTLADLQSTDPNAQVDQTQVLSIGVASSTPDARARRVLYQAYIGRL